MAWYYLNTASTSSPEEEEGSLEICCSEESHSERLNLSHTRRKRSSQGRKTVYSHNSQSGTILQLFDTIIQNAETTSTDSEGSETSLLLPGDFHAKISVQQEKEKVSTGLAQGFGVKCQGWFAKYDQSLSLWKTPQCSLLEDYIEFLETWPKQGTMQNGKCWERTMLEPDIEERESGYLPTPTCADAAQGAILNENTKLIKLKSGNLRKISNQGTSGSLGLARTVKMWPTPRANENDQGKKANGMFDGLSSWKAQGRGATLSTQVKQMYPTPTKRDYKDSQAPRIRDGKVQVDTLGRAVFHKYPTPCVTGMASGSGSCEKANQLYEEGVITDEERKSMRSGNGGQLNPDWVEFLMGWPIGWSRTLHIKTSHILSWDKDPADSGEIPRIAINIPQRIPALKSIGNGQVPLCAAKSFLTLFVRMSI